MKQILAIAGFLLMGAGTAVASNADSIRTAGQVYLQTPGARADGLGGCGTLLGEANSGLSNPAAQVLMDDVAAAIYYNPKPYFLRGRDFWIASIAAHSDFGYTGFHYMRQSGYSNSDDPQLRPEEASVLQIAGRAWKNLGAGVAFKILTTQKNQFSPLGASLTKSYKMGFDLGVVYWGLLPRTTWDRVGEAKDDFRLRFGRKFVRGFTLGVAFQNLGGQVDYSDVLTLPLPQTFRANLMWGALKLRYGDLRVMGEVQKILVMRDPITLGYRSAWYSLFHAWGSGNLKGSWVSRLGIEATILSLASFRAGWSVDHGANRSFDHLGLGLGPEWARLDLAWIHEPGSVYTWWDGFRVDVSANLTYDKLRRWMKTA